MRAISLIALLICCFGVRAADLAPDDRQIAAAISRGQEMAAAHGGYWFKNYIVWAVPDAKNIDPTTGDVDAVLLATPIERATHAGFVAAYDGKQLSVAEARRSKDLQAGCLRIILFTHGPNAKDESYVDRFANPRLVFPDGTIFATKTEHSDPTESTYPLALENRRRKVATITFYFDLSSMPKLHSARSRLQFTDDKGKEFDLPIDLGVYP
jgi:hypothetical protein